eukprot:COSAG02_NODE_58151_length_278_cov_0.815642_1_plen_61_part_01
MLCRRAHGGRHPTVGDPVEGLEEDEPTATKVLARAQVAGADSVVAAEVETGGRGAAAMAVA